MHCVAMCLLPGPRAHMPRVHNNREGGTSMVAQPLKDLAPVTSLGIRLVPGGPPAPHRPGASTPSAARTRPVLQPPVPLLAGLTPVGGLAATALAQSSGNFDAAVAPTVCVLNSGTGTVSPLCPPTATGTACALLDTTIKTSNGTGVTLL